MNNDFFNISGFDGKINKMMPPGLLVEQFSKSASKASEAIGIIEDLIKSESVKNFEILQKLFLENFDYGNENETGLEKILKNIFPQNYHKVIESLTISEQEIFFKFFILGHESIGKIEFSKLLVKAFVENIAGHEINVILKLYNKQKKEITPNFRSYLGQTCSTLGNEFILGKEFYGRPIFIDIIIGPIELKLLHKFQSHELASENKASAKLKNLVSLTEPYYYKFNITFLVAKLGFKLGESTIGGSRLGSNFIL